MQRDTLIYIVWFALFAIGMLVILNGATTAGALMILASGIVAVGFARRLAIVQTRINAKTPLAPTRSARPVLFVVWDVAIAFVALFELVTARQAP